MVLNNVDIDVRMSFEGCDQVSRNHSEGGSTDILSDACGVSIVHDSRNMSLREDSNTQEGANNAGAQDSDAPAILPKKTGSKDSADNGEESAWIYHVDDGSRWASYLQKNLCEKYNIPCKAVPIGEVSSAPASAVNVILITPNLVDKDHLSSISTLGKQKSVLILTGVHKEEFEATARKQNCDSLTSWNIHVLDGSEDSIRQMRVFIIGLYEQRCYSELPAPRQVNELVTTYWKVSKLLSFKGA